MDMKNLMRQAQEMQKKMKDVQDKLSNSIFEGESGGGLVKISMSGDNIAKKIFIDNSILKEGEKDILEDLIIAAINDVRKKIDESSSGSMNNVTGGLSLPKDFIS
jgi:DNA-binding YbaB/EbfC family protein